MAPSGMVGAFLAYGLINVRAGNEAIHEIQFLRLFPEGVSRSVEFFVMA